MKKIMIILIFSTSAFAFQKVETQVKSSKSNLSSTLNYHYAGEKDSVWSTYVMASSNRSKVKDASGDTEITRELQWINNWDLPYNWVVELGVGGSNTRLNKIRTGNADLTFGRTNKDFYFFDWSITVGINNIKQTEGRTASASELSLQQTKSGFQMGIEPLDWMSVSIFYNKYKYDKDVDQQILLLQNETAVQRYGTAFSNQLSTLVEKEAGLTLGFYMTETWKLSIGLVQTQDAPEPNVKGTSTTAKLYHKFSSDWDGSVTVGSNQYESTSTTPSARYGFVGLAAGFSW